MVQILMPRYCRYGNNSAKYLLFVIFALFFDLVPPMEFDEIVVNELRDEYFVSTIDIL